MPDEWQTVAEPPPLKSGEVHIWRVDFSQAAAEADKYMRNLTTTEAERAARFRAREVKLQFVLARACLRVLLGRHLNMRATDVPITLSAHGKPEVSPGDGGSLFFNLAHSRETILIVLCRESPIGTDLEYLDRETDALDIARNSFTPREFLHIEQAGTAAERRKAFFRLWTRKEAVMKADGRGLSIALSAVEVPVSDRAISSPVRIAGAERAAAGGGLPPTAWFVTDLALGEGIASAFATGLAGLPANTWRFCLDWLG